ncbi:MAG: hypothetical protein J6U92_00705 [Clostridia bacterium]|nr:hypothetical protein [Clostridia bacterium]
MQYILIPIAISIVFSLLWRTKTNAEKKMPNESFIRTRPPKILTGFFLGFAIAGTCGGIVLGIINRDNTENLIGIILSFSIIAIIGFFGYMWVRFNYVVIDGDNIIVYRLFQKNKLYSFDEVAFFKDTTHMGIQGGLICYDKNKKKLFSVEAIHIGVSLIIQRLREKNIAQIF